MRQEMEMLSVPLANESQSANSGTASRGTSGDGDQQQPRCHRYCCCSSLRSVSRFFIDFDRYDATVPTFLPTCMREEEVLKMAQELEAYQMPDPHTSDYTGFPDLKPLPLRCVAGPAIRFCLAGLLILWTSALLIPFYIRFHFTPCGYQSTSWFSALTTSIVIPILLGLEYKCMRYTIVPQTMTLNGLRIFGLRLKERKCNAVAWLIYTMLLSMLTKLDVTTNAIFFGLSSSTFAEGCTVGILYNKIRAKETLHLPISLYAQIFLSWCVMMFEPICALLSACPLTSAPHTATSHGGGQLDGQEVQPDLEVTEQHGRRGRYQLTNAQYAIDLINNQLQPSDEQTTMYPTVMDKLYDKLYKCCTAESMQESGHPGALCALSQAARITAVSWAARACTEIKVEDEFQRSFEGENANNNGCFRRIIGPIFFRSYRLDVASRAETAQRKADSVKNACLLIRNSMRKLQIADIFGHGFFLCWKIEIARLETKSEGENPPSVLVRWSIRLSLLTAVKNLAEGVMLLYSGARHVRQARHVLRSTSAQGEILQSIEFSISRLKTSLVFYMISLLLYVWVIIAFGICRIWVSDGKIGLFDVELWIALGLLISFGFILLFSLCV